MATVNHVSILQKCVVAIATDKRLESLAYGAALGKFNYHKNIDLLKEFDKHPVTEEIKAGPDADSYFLPRGNLFSFIGFFKGEDPTGDIRQVIETQTRIQRNPVNKIIRRNSVVTQFRVTLPQLKEIWAVSPFPEAWKSGSWADDIEMRGISHFEYYVFSFAFKKDPRSRSGTGLQLGKQDGVEAFGQTISPIKQIPYIRQLFANFSSKFR